MDNVELGRYERLNLREGWPTEDRDFTHWLARPENLNGLGKEIGIKLRLVGVEQPVGSFRADILCENVADDSAVIIENQLEGTDHSHLGQLVTYAAAHEADTIVWIAAHFRDEHSKALDYLNRRTDEKANFFGVIVELGRLGTTVRADFQVVSGPPSALKKTTRKRSQPARPTEPAGEGGLTPAAQLRLEYWSAFKRVVEADPGPLRTAKPGPESWYCFAIGRSHFWLAAKVESGTRRINVQLNIDGDTRRDHSRALEARKSQIEAELGVSLEWNELPNNKIVRIVLWRPDTDVENRADWPRQHAWLLETLKAFHRAFADRIQALGG